MKTYRVKKIFLNTLQGEGPNTGRSCSFLRFAGCNSWDGRPETKAESPCFFCDTDFAGGEKLTANEIVDQLDGTGEGAGLVITGGEPLLQLDQELINVLSGDFAWVDIETNGTVKPKFYIPPRVRVSCSPKRVKGLPIVVTPDWWKVLIPHQECFMPMALESGLPVYVQPVMIPGDALGYRFAVEACMELCHKYASTVRFSHQLHKTLGIE